MPVFSTYLRSLGISHVDIGLLSSLYGATQLFTGPIVGSWSDINGRKSILCLTMVICSLAYGLMGLVSSFYLFLLIRCVLGSLKHTQTLCRAFVADIVPPDKQAAVHGLTNAFTSFSFMVAPIISGHLMEVKNGFQYLTVLVMLIFLLNAIVVFTFASSKNTKKPTSQGGFSSQLLLVFEELYSIDWKKYWALFSIKFLFALSGMLFFQNIGLIFTESFETTPRLVGYTISFYGFSSGVSNLGVGKIRKLAILPASNLKCLGYTFFLMTVTFFLLFSLPSLPLYFVCLAPLATSHSLSRIFITEVMLESSDAKCRGSMMGAASSVAAVARTIAPFLSGVIISKFGPFGPLLVASLFAASSCVLAVYYSRQNHTKST